MYHSYLIHSSAGGHLDCFCVLAMEDRMVKINEAEREKEKSIKRNEGNLIDLWDNVKCPNIRIIGVPEEKTKKKSHEKILEDIIGENFPQMGKEIATQGQDTKRVPKRINLRQNTPRHINQINKDQTQRANIKSSKGRNNK